MSSLSLRLERDGDEAAISALTQVAFRDQPYRAGTEAQIIEGLREDGNLALSLVAVERGEILGQISFSPVSINGEHDAWFGVGPVSVTPARQSEGIGAKLVLDGLDRLRALGANGCVLVGDPAYYSRFGFEGDCGLSYGDLDRAYVQGLALTGPFRTGTIQYARAFEEVAE